MKKPETTIYRADHIVGRIDSDLTPELYRSWGRSLGRLITTSKSFIVSSDGRDSSVTYKAALIEGLNDEGIDVIDIGKVPLIIALFTIFVHETAGNAHVAGFQHPSDLNGLCWNITGTSLEREEQVRVLQRESLKEFAQPPCKPRGRSRSGDAVSDWIAWQQENWFDTPKVPMLIVIDPLYDTWAGLFRRALQLVFPHIVAEAIHDELDSQYGGLVPFCRNPESIQTLCTEVEVRRADMGIAIDGDTGCLTIINALGTPLSINEQNWLMLQSFASSLAGEKVIHTGIFPELFLDEVRRLGGVPVQAKMEHEDFLQTMQRTRAIIGFDHCGRVFSRISAGHYITFMGMCWLIDHISRSAITFGEFCKTIPPCHATQELMIPWCDLDDLIPRLRARWNVEPTIDGFGVNTSNGRIHIREVRDFALVAFQFSAKNRRQLDELVDDFITLLKELDQSGELGQSLFEAFARDSVNDHRDVIESSRTSGRHP